MKILFKYASRSRPKQFIRGLESIINNVLSDSYHILVTADLDDDSMDSSEVLGWVEENISRDKITFDWGVSESKVHAINRGMEEVPEDFKDWDVLVCMSDDMVFIEMGFDEDIRDSFIERKYSERHYDEYTLLDQFLHFPDGNRNDLCTMSIIGRGYYDKDGYIYNPEYKSLFCDDEAQQVAKQRGCYKYIDKQIFEHKHPAYGKAVFDEQYQKTEAIGNSVDRETFLRRKEINFGL